MRLILGAVIAAIVLAAFAAILLLVLSGHKALRSEESNEGSWWK